MAEPTVPPPTADQVRNLLRAVIDPELGANIVDLGMATDVTVGNDGAITIGVKLTIKGCRCVPRSRTTSSHDSKRTQVSRR